MVDRIILFPGQGAQYPGMGKDLYERSSAVKELCELASECSHVDLTQVLFAGDVELLRQTEYTQIAITFVNTASYMLLKEQGVSADMTAGFSLGELSAYYAAGIIDLESLFRITALRGKIMAAYAKEITLQIGELGMAAVIGLDYAYVSSIIADESLDYLFIANDNSTGQIVLAGVQRSIDRISSVLKANGARRVIPLKVSGPFHTPLMHRAAEEYGKILEEFAFIDPTIPVYSNVTGEILKSGNEAKAACALQLTSTVRWTKIVDDIAHRYTNSAYCCYEVGPGKVLTGFWKTGPAKKPCVPMGTYEALSARKGVLA